MSATTFMNRKTGGHYTWIMEATDATNGREGRTVVVYSDVHGRRFVRDKAEFEEKFVMVKG